MQDNLHDYPSVSVIINAESNAFNPLRANLNDTAS
jgi:hypothetical protein